MLIRSESIHDVGPGIETISTAVQPNAQVAGSAGAAPRAARSVIQSEPVEQHRQLYPAHTLRRLETQGLGPAPDQLALLNDQPWIATLLELASEVADRVSAQTSESEPPLATRLLEDINGVELLAAYRRIIISG